jgi:hypothetical protein
MDLAAHKRALNIIHIVIGALSIASVAFIAMFMDAVIPFILDEIAQEGDKEAAAFLELGLSIGRTIIYFVVLLVTLPSILGGIAVLNGKNWGMVLLMISGCISLLNIPIGTAKGVYTIWVFVEDNKANNDQNKQ